MTSPLAATGRLYVRQRTYCNVNRVARLLSATLGPPTAVTRLARHRHSPPEETLGRFAEALRPALTGRKSPPWDKMVRGCAMPSGRRGSPPVARAEQLARQMTGTPPKGARRTLQHVARAFFWLQGTQMGEWARHSCAHSLTEPRTVTTMGKKKGAKKAGGDDFW